MTSAALLGRRLADLRRERERAAAGGGRSGPPVDIAVVPAPSPTRSARAELAARGAELAQRLADAVDGRWMLGESGGYVRVEREPILLPIDRERLGRLPDAAPPEVPLVCLDTETTGLATAAGTVAFLVGLGWWRGDRFHQVQLLLPDHAEEPALLDAVAAAIPPDAWLVTYNGRGFDWPLLVARYRMTRRGAPAHAGHLDLLPFVRRVFRHRMTDARLRTVETELLGLDRGPDLEGWEIPGRYLGFLRGGTAAPLADVVRHNHEDVRSLARLLRHIERDLGDREVRRVAPPGDLAGLARSYRRHGRVDEALDCIDIALEAPVHRQPPPSRPEPVIQPRTVPWSLLLTTRADAGPAPAVPRGRSSRPGKNREPLHADTLASGREGLLVDRARLLRRLGRHDDALETWLDLAAAGGPLSGVAWIEVAKIREHRRRDPAGALDACLAAERVAARSRGLGRPLAGIESDLDGRRRRLTRRLARTGSRILPGAPDAPSPALASTPAGR